MRLVASLSPISSQQLSKRLLMSCKRFPTALVKRVQFVKVCQQEIGRHQFFAEAPFAAATTFLRRNWTLP
jgi:hypothetical protein